MAAKSKIEWTQATWNPVAGCTRVSPGCDHCYAVKQTYRLERFGHLKYAGLTVLNGRGERHFNGVVRCDESALKIPLRRRKPTIYFVNSMSDLFHEGVPDEFINKVFDVMERCAQHTFQILTKRAPRMAKYTSWRWGPREDGSGNRIPARNVWLGVSVEDQQRLDDRVSHLLRCHAAVLFLSLEPLLGPMNLKPYLPHKFNREPHCTWCEDCIPDSVNGGDWKKISEANHGPFVSWVIVGGESGPGARPCNVAWIRSIVEQCKSAGVACFVKQLGSRPIEWVEIGKTPPPRLKDPKAGDPSEWPEDLRVREMPKLPR